MPPEKRTTTEAFGEPPMPSFFLPLFPPSVTSMLQERRATMVASGKLTPLPPCIPPLLRDLHATGEEVDDGGFVRSRWIFL
jgi:hypothetical protein